MTVFIHIHAHEVRKAKPPGGPAKVYKTDRVDIFSSILHLFVRLRYSLDHTANCIEDVDGVQSTVFISAST